MGYDARHKDIALALEKPDSKKKRKDHVQTIGPKV